MYDVAIIGAGAVGVNTALFLSKTGFSVVLLDSADDILDGAPRASFINHGDGFEYFKRGHEATGRYCIDGSIAKSLIYPLQALTTNVCSKERPLRFFVSADSIEAGLLRVDEFLDNAEAMHNHFSKRFASIRDSLHLTKHETEELLLRQPRDFFRRLDPSEYPDVMGVAVGCAGSSFGINMPHYYAFLKSAIAREKVVVHFSEETATIENVGTCYQINTNRRSVKANFVLLTAGHHIPALAAKVQGTATVPPSPGTFYLNCIVFLKLPATSDNKKLDNVSRINFAIQQEHGAMYACIVPPDTSQDGVAAIYYPSLKGSQLEQYLFDPNNPTPPPNHWDEIARDGLDPDSNNVKEIFRRACSIYPFLVDYAEITGTLCRTVFNASTPDSDRGLDRRVRELPASVSKITEDGRVSSWTSPKWTNAELVSLMAADNICSRLKGQGLPRMEGLGFGPSSLNVAEISKQVNFLSLRIRLEDALSYARAQGLPDRIVDAKLSQFLP
jgi:hypothetical protein